MATAKKKPAKKAAKKKPAKKRAPAIVKGRSLGFISDEDFACNRDLVRIVAANGDIPVHRGDSTPPIEIRGLKVNWYCENPQKGESDLESWDAPGGTAYVTVTRGATGGHGKVTYWKG